MAEPAWRLERFDERFDAWVASQAPSQERRIVVYEWILSRMDHPYQGMRLQEGFDNLWFGHVPGTRDPSDDWVVCSYWIFQADWLVVCDNFATLNPPFA